jgi:hypothetical protein
MSEELTESRRLDRRTAMKRIGAGAAVAWSAPALASFASPAGAGSPQPCGPIVCFTFQSCNGDPACFCAPRRPGPGQVCWSQGFFSPGGNLCNSDADCAAFDPNYPNCVEVDPNSSCNTASACVNSCVPGAGAGGIQGPVLRAIS